MGAREKVLVALDVNNIDEALKIVDEVGDLVKGFKVGLELCTNCGVQSVISAIGAVGGKLFVDLKFKDIPNTCNLLSFSEC